MLCMDQHYMAPKLSECEGARPLRSSGSEQAPFLPHRGAPSPRWSSPTTLESPPSGDRRLTRRRPASRPRRGFPGPASPSSLSPLFPNIAAAAHAPPDLSGGLVVGRPHGRSLPDGKPAVSAAIAVHRRNCLLPGAKVGGLGGSGNQNLPPLTRFRCPSRR
ncbi:hypothetical protein ABZP36_001660 [Zizania latifolia]